MIGAFAKSQIGIASMVIIRNIISILLMFLLLSFTKLKINTTKHNTATTRVGRDPYPAPDDLCNKNSINTMTAHKPQVKTCGFDLPFKILLI